MFVSFYTDKIFLENKSFTKKYVKWTQAPGTNMRCAIIIIILTDHCHRDDHLSDVGDVDIVQHYSSSLAAAQPTLVGQKDKF